MKPIRTNWILLSLLLGFSQQCISQDLSETLRDSIQERIDKGYHLATVVGVVDENGARYYNFGQLSVSDDTPPDENSIFEIGSITKAFTAILFADLSIEEGFDLDLSAQDMLPNVLLPSYNNNVITLESLLTHTSGLPREPTNMAANADDRYSNYTVEEMYEFLTNLQLSRNIGSESVYSNAGYALLGHMAELHSEKSYEQLIVERIATVLGMDSTSINVNESERARLVSGFRYGETTSEIRLGIFPAMGGIRSTAKDMLIFLAANLGLNNSLLLPAMELTHTPRVPKPNTEDTMIGLAWEILDRPSSGETIIYHTGGTNGFVTFAGMNKRTRKGVVVLNSGRRYFSDIGFHILDPSYPIFEIEDL